VKQLSCPRMCDLEFGSLLGEGAFARVFHTRDKRSGQFYALKVIEKRQIQAQNRRDAVISEKNILMSLDHPSVARLYLSFQDDVALYFALELIEGGELALQIDRMGNCSFEFSQFYAAEIVVILEYLRSRRIAHRDLKPQNLLLTHAGHLKLVDFDAAIVVPDEGEGDAAGGCGQSQELTCAGTALYLPPEVLLSTVQLREAFALDLWAFGCVVFQMLVGKTPFHATPEYVMFQLILKCEYSFPYGFQHKSAQALIDALLQPQPDQRLGAKGFDELKHHHMFGDVGFDNVLLQRPPPRLDRLVRQGSIASEDSCGPSFDLSSAECTPEVGQGFLSRFSAAIPVSDATDVRLTDEITMTIDTLQSSPSTSSTHYECTEIQAPVSTSRPSSPSWRQAPPHLQRMLARPNLSNPCQWIRPDMPFVTWQQWLRELSLKKVLLDSEAIVICGSVVRRNFPCMKPKVLMLTDRPRLLLLDSSGLRLVQEFKLTGDRPTAIIKKAPYDFEVRSPQRRYQCYDPDIGAVEWENAVEAAREQLSSKVEPS